MKLAKPPSGTIHVTLTGDMCVQVGDDVVASTAFPGRQGRLMFAYLASHPGPVSRGELAEVLWPAGPPRYWRRDLSALASRLRTLLTGLGSRVRRHSSVPVIGTSCASRNPSRST